MRFRFLGTGNAASLSLGNSSAVLEVNPQDHLMIDIGHTALHAFQQHYNALPRNVYITHVHLDHIAGLEGLFYASFKSEDLIKLFVPVSIIPLLHQRIASIIHMPAEGGKTFWDAFQLIPVQDHFWFAGMKFSVFESRHHQPRFCFGLSLPGVFAYTGDTKPIPEVLSFHASQNEIIFHDLSTLEQPSHTHVKELSQYPKVLLDRMWFYHLADNEEAHKLRLSGLKIVSTGQEFDLERWPDRQSEPTCTQRSNIDQFGQVRWVDSHYTTQQASNQVPS